MTDVLNFLQTPAGKVIVMLAVLTILVVAGVYVVLRFRGQADDDRPSAQDMLKNFREMREQGDISDAEFRKLKTALSDKLEQELNDTADKGYDQEVQS